MKKALSFAVALGLVVGAAYVASAATLDLSGDARVRGVYKNNGTDFTDANQDKAQFMDQRYRLNANVKVNDDVTINTRLVFGNVNSQDQIMGDNNSLDLTADIADMSIKTLGGTWTIGRQDVNWGNDALPFLLYDVPMDRVYAAYDVAGTTVGAYYQKTVEGYPVYNNGDGDMNEYGLLAVGKAGGVNYGALAWYDTSNTDNAKLTGHDSGWGIDPYFNTQIGSATLLGEIAYMGGDLNQRNDKDVYGGYVAGVVDLKPLTVIGLGAYARNGYTASPYFAPSLLIGTNQATAIINFGQTCADTDSGNYSYLLGGKAMYQITDKFSVGGLLGYLSATQNGVGGNTGTLVEVDVTAKYALAQNTTYNFGVSYGSPSHLSIADDPVYVVGNSVEIAF